MIRDSLREINIDHSVDFMQGVSDRLQAFKLTPLQIGVFATFVPPARGYIVNQGNLYYKF